MSEETTVRDGEDRDERPAAPDASRDDEATRERLFRSVLSWRKPDSGRWRVLRSR